MFTSKTKIQELAKPFNDGRSAVAKRHRVAVNQTKHEMVASMIHRALRAGIQGHYLLADAWFGSKAIIRLCQETALTVILRMKKSKLKYRMSEYINGEIIKRDMDVKCYTNTLFVNSGRK